MSAPLAEPPAETAPADDAPEPAPGPPRLWPLPMVDLVRRLLPARREGQTEAEAEQAATRAEADAHERRLIANILEIRDLPVVDLMVPRADIIAVPETISLQDLLAVMARTAHSRLPVYRETLDDVIGLVHIKDTLTFVADAKPFSLKDVLREILFVAPSMRVLDLLLELRTRRVQMALIVDEFGGVDGLITIEDLLEGIVGEIQDEHERGQPAEMIERPDGSIIAHARVSVEDFETLVGPVLDEEEREDNDTLGGLVFSLAGRVPARGELLRHPSGLEFEILDADPRRIRRLRILHVAEARRRLAEADGARPVVPA